MPIPRNAPAGLTRGLRTAVAVVLATLGLVLVPAAPASAASAGWADISLEGSANDWTGTLRQRAAGFPVATISSDSAGGSAVGRQSGSSTFLPGGSDVGQRYGSSRGRPYLNLRPYTANGSGVPGSSTTTYTFAAPTPASGWTFVLGDVDADQVRVVATGPDGTPVAAEDLGFRSVFSYCGGSRCPASDDVPSWDEATATLVGNPSATDTDGASAWFEPRVPLSTLTFVFTRRAGFPAYQTWFAAQSHTLGGTVSAPGSRERGLTVRLYAPDGRLVDETRTDGDGRYSFDDLATYDGYRVALVRPSGLTSNDPLSRTVDLADADRVVDFALRRIVPVLIGGTVLDADGRPVPGVTVRLTGPGQDRTTVTGADGGYVFDDVAAGEGYVLTAEAPDATSVSGPRTFAVPVDREDPIGGQDFRVTPDPRGSVGGRVVDEDDGPVPGTSVTLTDEDGVERVATTDVDGRWSLGGLPPGDYSAAVVPPEQSEVVGDAELDVTVPKAGGSVDDVDFVLRLPDPPTTYAARGRVTDSSGRPVAGVRVVVRDPDGSVLASVRTDRDGRWEVDGLLAAQGWTARVRPPDGYDADDPDTRTFAVTDADVDDLDLVLDRRSSGAGSSGSSSTRTIAATGGPGLGLPLLGLAGLTALTAGLVLVHRSLRRAAASAAG